MKAFMIIGMVILGLVNIVGIGITLYLWGATGMAFGLALWTAFKFWISGIVIGFGFVGLSFHGFMKD